MPARAKNASYSDLYSRAWKVCVDLWPLWVARFLYIICNYGAFIVCVLFTFWPLISQVLQNQQAGGHLSSADYQALIMDFFGRFKDLSFLGAVAVLAVFYLIWWTVISAWFNGGLFGRLTAWVREGEPFSWLAFGRDGFYHLIPMVLLQLFLVVLLILILGALCFIGFLGFLLLGLLHFPGFLGLVLALPLGLALILFFLAYQVFALVAQAGLMENGRVMEAVEKSYQSCSNDGFRVLKALLLMILMATGVLIVLTLFFKALELIPVLGILFLLVDFGLRVVFYMVTDIYFPALAVVSLSPKAR